MAKRGRGPLSVDVSSLLPPLKTAEAAPAGARSETSLVLDKDVLARLPALLSPAQAATWLGVSTETINRHIRTGRQEAVEVLGITRIPAASAVEQVRARVIKRLPARYRKSKPAGEAQKSTHDDASAPQIPRSGTK